MKRILVACGNGIATSTVVATKVREYLQQHGIDDSNKIDGSSRKSSRL